MKHSKKTQLAAALAACLILLATPWFGVVTISPLDLLLGTLGPDERQVFFQVRLPRTLTAFLVGGGLAAAGLTYQALFRNILATPYSLGVASGATLGAGIAMQLGFVGVFAGVAAYSLGAMLGAFLTVMLVVILAARQGFQNATIVLVGVLLSFFFSSALLFVQYLSDPAELFRLNRWLLGSVAVYGYDKLPFLAVMVLAVLALLWWLGPALNLLSIDEEFAASRGVSVRRVKIVLFSSTALMVGLIASLYGLIGFIDIVVPYVCRLVFGAEHRRLAPTVFLISGALLALCDAISRTLIAPVEIPVGVTAALIGGPACLLLILFPSSRRLLVRSN